MIGYKFHLRIARAGDFPSISKLIETSFHFLPARHYTRKQIESSVSFLLNHDINEMIADRTYYVLEIKDQIVGCGGWSKRKALHGRKNKEGGKPKTDLLNSSRVAAKIRANFVHPDWVRLGIASEILKVSCEAARKAGFRKLELLATFTGEPLYLAHGFRVVKHLDIHFPDGVKAPSVKMTKTLD